MYSKSNLFLAASIFLAYIKTSEEATFFKCYSYLKLAVAVQSGVSLTFLAYNLWCSSLIETSDIVKWDSPITKCFTFKGELNPKNELFLKLWKVDFQTYFLHVELRDLKKDP